MKQSAIWAALLLTPAIALFGCSQNSGHQNSQGKPTYSSSRFEYRDWIEISKNPTGTVFINPSQYGKNGNVIKYWVYTHLTKPENYKGKSVVNWAQLYSIDCNTNETIGPFRVRLSDKDNKGVDDMTPQPEALGPAWPYSAGHAAGMFMCKYDTVNTPDERDQVISDWNDFYKSEPLKDIKAR